ncbi:hypothetical protein BDFB_009156 [Asbolus verrucosus]|uniref:Uncharacterized protein n=1 Tax=Asbolus verrucosus TaxID=1661398 RepID=A0A482W8H5_ASBVE|nr:hypothetical protein BDFB_009156 [Asbolus verrucosus]
MNPQHFKKFCLKSKFTNPGNTNVPAAPNSEIVSGVNAVQNCTADEPSTAMQTKEESEFEQVGKELEDYVNARRKALEDKMFEKFYLMRVEQSRKFIEVIEKINKQWENFLDYLKSIGCEEVSGDGDCTVYSLSDSSGRTG